jgi:invasion protein IalB
MVAPQESKMAGTAWSLAGRLREVAPIAAALLIGSALPALAQQKAQPPSPAQPQSPPANAQPPAAGVPQQQSMPPLTYSKWTKLCDRNADTKSKQLCRTGRDGRLDSGVPLVAAALIEIEGEPKRVLQVTVPAGVMLPRGTRVLIDDDENQATVAQFLVCTNSGCLAQVEFDANGVSRLKKGKNLYIQAFSMQQTVMTLSLPLAEFAKAYDGPPADPKQVEEQNQKLIEELQKKQQAAQPAAPAKR